MSMVMIPRRAFLLGSAGLGAALVLARLKPQPEDKSYLPPLPHEDIVHLSVTEWHDIEQGFYRPKRHERLMVAEFDRPQRTALVNVSRAQKEPIWSWMISHQGSLRWCANVDELSIVMRPDAPLWWRSAAKIKVARFYTKAV